MMGTLPRSQDSSVAAAAAAAEAAVQGADADAEADVERAAHLPLRFVLVVDIAGVV